jgi:acetyl-CoA C-acetyltransferase
VPAGVSALTVNMVCGSGLRAVMLAAQAVRAGDARVVVAGGQESMSNAPYLNFGMRSGAKFGEQRLADAVQLDGLWCATCDVAMGGHAEYTARKAGITREQQDRFAATSQQRAHAATAAGKFSDEIVPVQVPGARARRPSTPTRASAATPRSSRSPSSSRRSRRRARRRPRRSPTRTP